MQPFPSQRPTSGCLGPPAGRCIPAADRLVHHQAGRFHLGIPRCLESGPGRHGLDGARLRARIAGSHRLAGRQAEEPVSVLVPGPVLSESAAGANVPDAISSGPAAASAALCGAAPFNPTSIVVKGRTFAYRTRGAKGAGDAEGDRLAGGNSVIESRAGQSGSSWRSGWPSSGANASASADWRSQSRP